MYTQEDLNNVQAQIRRALGAVPERYIIVDTAPQRLTVVSEGNAVQEFSVSTSRFGIGNEDGSFKTPPGVHRICEKIGAGAPAGRIFRDRIDTGEDWPIGKPGDNLILTRILRLEGLQQGLNKGNGIDSYERFIYIHGTNNEDRIGRPISQGCVCMKNDDIIRLFDSIEEGAIVFIN
jgi:lipoprotein-anchoring transpeptidase ErfK/SrfK